MSEELSIMELGAEASEEARRLYEREFHYHNPYTRVIDTGGIPYTQEEQFCQMVEEELRLKGETIHRHGTCFKIDRYQKK